MGKRKNLSKKLRFEVLKRDSFKCQYCGGAAPDVLLHIDHIKPIKDDGTNDIFNLITSCIDCNQGKGARLISDKTIVEKQRKQLEELNERRQQLEMMMNWRKELIKFENEKVESIKKYFESVANCTLTDLGKEKLRKTLKKYPLELILEAIDVSTKQYLIPDENNLGYTNTSRDKALDYVSRICNCKVKEQDKPYLKEIYYIRGILRKRIPNCDNREVLTYLKDAYNEGVTVEFLKNEARIAWDLDSFYLNVEQEKSRRIAER